MRETPACIVTGALSDPGIQDVSKLMAENRVGNEGV